MNMTNFDHCFDCPAGYFCYGDADIHLCDRGRYCPGNTTYAGQSKCPIGTYNPDKGTYSTANHV